MRWIFILFLAANFAMFFWGYQRDHILAKSRTVVDANVPTIYLVGESRDTETQSADDFATSVAEPIAESQSETESTGRSVADATSRIVDSEPAHREAAEGEIVPEVPETEMAESTPDSVQEVGEPKLASVDLTDVTETDQVEESVDPVIEETIPDESRLEPVISEEAEVPAPEPVPQEIAAPTEQCVTLGPVAKQSEADELAGRLAELGREISIRDEMAKKQIGYWVLIPPMETRAAAREMVNKLGEAGITDVWRFPRGDLRNSISLGLFSRRFHAERRSNAIREKGFETEVSPRFIDVTTYWLDFSTTEDPPIPEDLWQEIAESIPDIELNSTACEQIATR